MGIRGLTTFIAKNSDCYFDTFELHDCSLVVDGNSLSSMLYNLYSKCVCAFGGDYDKYAHCVTSFFLALKKTGVKPLVIFDGGYETRKLKTVMNRLKRKIRLAKSITPISSKNKFFPLLMKEVFKDVLLDLAIPFAQCFLEADDEIAAIARKLNCPVLSYDSDFFVYDVFYIPFDTFDIQPYRRERKPAQNSDYFMSCQIYNVENFLNHFGGVKKAMVPLMATLLGNDYVERCTFKRFYASLKRGKRHPIGKRQAVGVTQRRIMALLRWLKQWDNVDSAVAAVLPYLKKERQRYIHNIIQQTVAGYTRCSSQLLPALGLSEDTAPERFSVTRNSSLPTDSFDNESDEASDDETLNRDNNSEEVQQASYNGLNSDIEGDQEKDDEDQDDDEIEEEEKEDDDDEDEEQDEEEDDDSEEEEEEEEQDGEKEDVLDDIGFMNDSKAYVNRTHWSIEQLPSWFKDLFSSGCLPSYFIDMLTLHTYFCSPQVEDYLLPSSHEISMPILMVIYSIIASGQKISKPLTFYLRNNRRQPQRSFLVPLVGVYPTLVSLGDLNVSERMSILMTSLSFSKDEGSTAIDCFPAEWRLFVASVICWGRTCHTPAVSNCHIHALLFALITLSVVDRNAGYHRTKLSKAFTNKVLKIKEVRNLTSKASKENELHNFTLEETLANVSHDDCMILVENILQFHQTDDKLKGNLKLYSVTTVHAFSQMQSILYHAIHLNGLLGFPLQQCRPAKMFSGTLVYNLYATFKKRSDVSGYIDLLLRPGRSVSELYKKLSQHVFELLSEVNVLRRKGNIRKKRHRVKEVSDSVDDQSPMTDEIAADAYCDMNNKFYALNLMSEGD